MEKHERNWYVKGRTWIWGITESELDLMGDLYSLWEWGLPSSGLFTLGHINHLCLWCPFAHCGWVASNSDISFVRLNRHFWRFPGEGLLATVWQTPGPAPRVVYMSVQQGGAFLPSSHSLPVASFPGLRRDSWVTWNGGTGDLQGLHLSF